jgi:hypothetical protein
MAFMGITSEAGVMAFDAMVPNCATGMIAFLTFLKTTEAMVPDRSAVMIGFFTFSTAIVASISRMTFCAAAIAGSAAVTCAVAATATTTVTTATATVASTIFCISEARGE